MNSFPFAEVRAWMFDAALPFWAAHGPDREYGGFLEELDFSGAPTACAFKRTRVIARQIYAFSHASVLGWKQGDALAKMGLDDLVAKAWLGPDGGWAKLLTRQGAVLDPTADLYDIAFVLLALAWRYRATGDAEALRRAHQTLDFIETHLRHPSGEGFRNAMPAAGPRQQNPHMHLFEAAMAGVEATGEQRFADLAAEMAALFRNRFFDGETLGEFFEEDWTRCPGEVGRVAEPGHHFEWAWLLGQHHRLTGEAVTPLVEAMLAFGERCGVDPHSGAVYNQVRDDGAPIDLTSRSWPNTERLKGWLALFELTGRDPRPAALQSARLLMNRYLDVTPRGSWIDHFDAAGRPIAKAVPASILYHMFLAFAELLRLEPRLAAAHG